MRRILPTMPREVAYRIAVEEAGDIRARFLLNDKAIEVNDQEDRSGLPSLIHAERYLADREEYTANPWPKNKIQLPALPHCKHAPLSKPKPAQDSTPLEEQ